MSSTLEHMDSLPRHPLTIASLRYRMRVERMAFSAVLLVVMGFGSFFAIQNVSLLKELKNPDAYFVPTHITDILRIRANMISDTLVYEFAENFVRDLANLNYQDANVRLSELGRYMHPSLRVMFLRSMKPHLRLWQAKRIDQVFSFEKISGFERRSEMFEGKERVVFVVPVWGEVRKYVDGREVAPYRELITLKLSTANVTSDKSWVFEVLDIKRQTQQELQDEKLAGRKDPSHG